MWEVKFDSSGTILWDKRYAACHGVEKITCAINTQDGGFLIGATIFKDSIPGCDVTEYAESWNIVMKNLKQQPIQH